MTKKLMKYFILTLANFCILVLSGCMTVYETTSPQVNTKFSSDAQLRIEGFCLETLQTTQIHTGFSSASAYNYKTGGWSSGSGSYSGTTYERRPDENFFRFVKDVFESSGANIRTQTPELTIEGRIGTGHFLWNSPELWYRDAPIFLLGVCTLGSVISCERGNEVTLLIYDKTGKRVKEYSKTARYHAVGIAFLLAGFGNEKVYEWYGDRMSAKFALIECLNDFIHDYNGGYYKPCDKK